MRLVLPDPGEWKQARIQWRGPLSDQQLMEFSERNQGFQVEWYGRERILVMSPTGSNSGSVSGILYAQVLWWAKARKAGRTFPADVGFRLSDGSVLSPDVAWVSDVRLTHPETGNLKGFPTVCPDLVVEVKSPSDTLGATRRKCRRWISEGARAALLVDSEKRHAELFLAGGEHRVLDEPSVTIPGFDGLTLDLNEAWDDVLGPAEPGK